jgi:hypothetical protein
MDLRRHDPTLRRLLIYSPVAHASQHGAELYQRIEHDIFSKYSQWLYPWWGDGVGLSDAVEFDGHKLKPESAY